MSLTISTRVQVNDNAPFTVVGEFGVISEIEGTTYIVQMEDGRERYFGADELTEVKSEDYTSWNNYKLLNMLERAIRTDASEDFIMDLQNEIHRRMMA